MCYKDGDEKELYPEGCGKPIGKLYKKVIRSDLQIRKVSEDSQQIGSPSV